MSFFYVLISFLLNALPLYADVAGKRKSNPTEVARLTGEQCKIAFEKLARLAQLVNQAEGSASSHKDPDGSVKKGS